VDAALIRSVLEIGARRTDDLADNDAFGAIDNESTAIGHHWDITHENLIVFFDFACRFEAETEGDLEFAAVGQIAFTAIKRAVFWLLETATDVFNEYGVGVVGDWEDFLHDIVDASVEEPFEGIRLDFDKVRQSKRTADFREIETVVDASCVILVVCSDFYFVRHLGAPYLVAAMRR